MPVFARSVNNRHKTEDKLSILYELKEVILGNGYEWWQVKMKTDMSKATYLHIMSGMLSDELLCDLKYYLKELRNPW